jgi:cytochrome c2
MTGRRWRSGTAAVAIVAAGLWVTACGTPTSSGVLPGADPARGQKLISFYGCGSCHQIGGVTGANGHVGPPLTTLRGRRYIAGLLPATAANVSRWIQHPQQIKPGTIMPDLGVTPRDGDDITAYLLGGQ